MGCTEFEDDTSQTQSVWDHGSEEKEEDTDDQECSSEEELTLEEEKLLGSLNGTEMKSFICERLRTHLGTPTARKDQHFRQLWEEKSSMVTLDTLAALLSRHPSCSRTHSELKTTSTSSLNPSETTESLSSTTQPQTKKQMQKEHLQM